MSLSNVIAAATITATLSAISLKSSQKKLNIGEGNCNHKLDTNTLSRHHSQSMNTGNDCHSNGSNATSYISTTKKSKSSHHDLTELYPSAALLNAIDALLVLTVYEQRFAKQFKDLCIAVDKMCRLSLDLTRLSAKSDPPFSSTGASRDDLCLRLPILISRQIHKCTVILDTLGHDATLLNLVTTEKFKTDIGDLYSIFNMITTNTIMQT